MLGRALVCAGALGLAVVGQQAARPAIRLQVDASTAPRRFLSVTERIPVGPGRLTLRYPKWIPGEHRPDGPIAGLAGLKFTLDGAPIAWQRDPLDAFTFHLVIPAGGRELTAAFNYLEPELAAGQLSGGAAADDHLLILNWNQVVLYPEGGASVEVSPSLTLPPSWQLATALGVGPDFGSLPLTRLIDSPLLAGEFLNTIDLTPPGEAIHHELDVAGDSSEAVQVNPALQLGLRNLVAEADALFGARHYTSYHFLLTVSDAVPHFGLEHHESDDARLPGNALELPTAAAVAGPLLSHEFVHSWNGKFRRPVGMAVTPYQTPMDDRMLWSYEGITNFLGYVLAARSGLWTPEQYRASLANIAAQMGPGRPGRDWRSLEDTGAALPAFTTLPGWVSIVRTSDFHLEGDLLWLSVAMKIADLSHGQKSFDDFCREFYGGPNQGPEIKPYTFNDLAAALDRVAPYDWASYLRRQVEGPAPEPLDGISAAGWHLSFSDRGAVPADLAYSLGFTADATGTVTNLVWGSPAWKAGLAPDMRIRAVNGGAFSLAALNAAVTARHAVQINAAGGDFTIDYHDGPRHPVLVRDTARPDYLDDVLLHPRVARR